MTPPAPGPFADPELAAWAESIRANPGPPARHAGAEALRAASRQRAAARPPGPRLAVVRDLAIPVQPGLRGRLYAPAAEPRPLLVYLHGGGWTIGDLDSHDRVCRLAASRADVAVLAVDYRRAPESRWPAALDDAVSALRWARAAGSALPAPDVVAVAGDSAGGNLAALACLRLRDAGDPPPVAQILLYPNTDLTFSQPSVAAKASGWGLDADDARWFAEQWVPDAALRRHPRVSPVFEPDLRGLPPALIVTAEHDPLRDEGDAYAARLRSAGVPVVHRCEPGLVHGFLSLDLVSPAAAAAGETVFADIRRLVGRR